MSWSAYIVGAMALLFIFIVFPFYFKRYHTVTFLSVNCAAILLYLLFIERMNGGQWFVGIGLPVTVTASIGIIILAMLFTKKQDMTILKKSASVLFALGLFVLVVEIIIRLNDRITSYNVCYTKLLRFRRQARTNPTQRAHLRFF